MNSGPHILVVDDDELNRRFMTQVLTREGYRVTCAPNATLGLQQVKTSVVDLLLLDVVMPGMNGLEMLKLLRQDYSVTDLPVIVVTALDGSENIVRAFDLGANDYLTRPLDVPVALARIRRQFTLVGPARRSAATTQRGDSDEPEEQQQIAGYTVIRVLGEGGAGVVYLAEGHSGNPTDLIALKVLKPMLRDESSRREMLERFLREAEIAMHVAHPNAVRILDYGLAEEAMLPFIAMEYVDGRPLRDLIADRVPITQERKIDLLRQMLELLDAIHSQHIVHRDIKPANILITDDWVVKVTDFGVARMANSDLTLTANVLGTPTYMAPEAFTSSQVGGQADLYSFGVVAYELLLGKLPFKGGDLMQLIDQVRNTRPIHPNRINPAFPQYLEAIIGRLLRKDPKRRYQTAADVLRDLKQDSPQKLRAESSRFIHSSESADWS